MLTLRDFLDYCDLTEAEVSKIALREHIPLIVAAQVALLRKQLGLMGFVSGELDADRDASFSDRHHAQHPPFAG